VRNFHVPEEIAASDENGWHGCVGGELTGFEFATGVKRKQKAKARKMKLRSLYIGCVHNTSPARRRGDRKWVVDENVHCDVKYMVRRKNRNARRDKQEVMTKT